MRLFTKVRLRLRSIVRGRQLEGELDEELRYHLDRLTELNRAGGMPDDEAKVAALRAFGGLEQRKEECRDMRGMALIDMTIVASVLSGLFPALHAVRRVQHDVLKAGGRRDSMSGPAHTRLSRALIIGEVALSLILLVGASLFVESFRNLL